MLLNKRGVSEFACLILSLQVKESPWELLVWFEESKVQEAVDVGRILKKTMDT